MPLDAPAQFVRRFVQRGNGTRPHSFPLVVPTRRGTRERQIPILRSVRPACSTVRSGSRPARHSTHAKHPKRYKRCGAMMGVLASRLRASEPLLRPFRDRSVDTKETLRLSYFLHASFLVTGLRHLACFGDEIG
jgi:hypothetical protein